jgi:transcriptional regulator with XRE-family HTH domain
MVIGAALKRKRKALSFTQTALASILGYHVSMISLWDRDLAAVPRAVSSNLSFGGIKRHFGRGWLRGERGGHSMAASR